MRGPGGVTVIDCERPFDLVHVGKCGGGTVVQELRGRGCQFEQFHMRKPVFAPGRRYVVLVRDPVARVVSAFRWRRHLLDGDLLSADRKRDPLDRLRQEMERTFLSQFRDVNEFAEQLTPVGDHDVSAISTMMALVAHVPQGFGWYLDELLDQLAPPQLLGVIAMERFADDFQSLFGFRPQAHRHRNLSERPGLSAVGRANLARELRAEYRTLARLAAVARQAGCPLSLEYAP